MYYSVFLCLSYPLVEGEEKGKIAVGASRDPNVRMRGRSTQDRGGVLFRLHDELCEQG